MKSYLDLLKQNGLKITPKRRAVIALFLKNNRRMGPREVYQKLSKDIAPLGLPTVYRILEELKNIGALMLIPSDDRQLYYVLCKMPDEHHHHFVCRGCRRVEEVEYCNFGAVSRFIEENLNGKVERHFLQIEGLCSKCRGKVLL